MAKGAKTGGRQKGSRNKTTVAKETFTMKIVKEAGASGVMPLDVMLDNMRFAFSQAGELIAGMMAEDKPSPDDFKQLVRLRAMAQSFASDAAPYLHPKLSSIEHKGDPDNPLETVTHIVLTSPETDDSTDRTASQAHPGIHGPS